VDYDQVANVKRAVLERCFALFQERHCGGDTELQAKTTRGQAFHDYVRNEGALLEAYAVFQAIAEAMQREHKDMWVWQQWPEPYRDPTSEAVATFRQTHRHEIQFHQYVQWMASEQLGAVAARTRESGMPIGLFHDLALGSDRSGSDAWVLQDVLTLGVDAGCPPDAFATQGQNWGLPPINPLRLQATGYNVFVDLLRHNMRTGGALRMDHVMGLFRLFWIPHGLPPSAGAYVRYPVEDLLGILALESVRNRTMVIGEDLGTVPNEVRERLAVARVLSYRVLYFERWEDGTWKAPETYPTQALAVVTTHDLPSLAGFWIGKDIEERARLGFYRDQDAQRVAWEERRLDKIRIWNALKAQHLLPAGTPDDPAAVPRMTSELCTAIHAYLAQTPSWLVLASLDDAIGQVEQPNLPGTLDTHPNWSRKLSDTIENLRSDPRPRQLASSLGALRPLR
jgi:4-alpha-glucanotransferase